MLVVGDGLGCFGEVAIDDAELRSDQSRQWRRVDVVDSQAAAVFGPPAVIGRVHPMKFREHAGDAWGSSFSGDLLHVPERDRVTRGCLDADARITRPPVTVRSLCAGYWLAGGVPD